MKKFLSALFSVSLGVMLLAPNTVGAYTQGYWQPYQTTQRVAYQAPETKYVCEPVSSYYYDSYFYGNRCYYTTTMVTKYRNESVTKYRWVETPVYAPVYYPTPTVAPVYYPTPTYQTPAPAPTTLTTTSRRSAYGVDSYTLNTFDTGYSYGYNDASRGRTSNPSRHYQSVYGYML